MAGKALGVNGAMKLLEDKQAAHVQRRADQLRDTVVQLHREAPRGGSYLNKYGQPRSAPGEPPATEEGRLLQVLEMPPSPIPGGYSVPVNRVHLEFGTATIAARPMGRLAIAQLRQDVENGG